MKVEDFLRINNKTRKNFLISLLKRILITIIIVLSVLILAKHNTKFKSKVNKYAFNTNYNFAKINSIYKKYLLSFKKGKENISKVNKTNILEYKSKKDYKDGVILEVDDVYNVKMLESGLVVFVGEKDGIRNTIIVQQSNGIDIVYGFINNTDVKVYDYVEKGTIIGTANKELYLAFQKEGESISYEPYIE